MAQAESTSAKWEAYHASDSSPPWESHDVTPQLNKLLNEISGKVDFTTLKAIELGCGDGKKYVLKRRRLPAVPRHFFVMSRAMQRFAFHATRVCLGCGE